jgi:dihydropteroate synthase
MGVLNVTPDSFSDGGRHVRLPDALRSVEKMIAAGVDIVDVGGESSRPGADPVDEQVETLRVVPVIEAIKSEHDVRVSVDTRRAAVARSALDAGADMVNDISGLGDPDMLPLLCERQTPVVLMHMRGTPRTMQRDTNYDDLVETLHRFLSDRVETAAASGLRDGKILVDPGIGFGKSAAGNLSILGRLPDLQSLRRPILIGASRKSFFGKLFDLPVDDRLEVGLAVAALASVQGAHMIRTHDVRQTVRTVRVIDAVRDPAAETAKL